MPAQLGLTAAPIAAPLLPAAAVADTSAALRNIRAAALASVMRENSELRQAAQDERIRRLEEELSHARVDAQRDRQLERSQAELAALRAAVLGGGPP
jgi:hypothetical protein